MRKTTIKDIAKVVGVSATTVSNVINGKDSKVSAEKLEMIKTTIKDLNYIPNSSARSLVQNKSKLIGVIIPQTENYKQLLLENPFYSEMVSGIEAKTRECGYNIILTGVDKDENYLDVFVRWNLDGAIIMGIYKEKFYEDLKSVNIPIVLVDSYVNDTYFYKIGIDDELGGYMAAKYLIEKGHKNIALVTGSIKKDGVTEKRFLGYKKALIESNIFYNSDYVFEKSVSYEYGMEAGKEIAKYHDNVTAVFATADYIAAGVISGLKSMGKEVPKDISVMGFDDVTFAKMIIPPLTTVRQEIYIKGQKAVEKVINAIETDNSESSGDEILSVSIVERESVKSI